MKRLSELLAILLIFCCALMPHEYMRMGWPLMVLGGLAALLYSYGISPNKVALITLSALCFGFPACTVNPFIRSGETVVSLGGSIFTKTAGESGYYEGPLGKLGYANATKDETVIPGKLINYYGIKSAVEGATAALRTTESTKRILSGHEVSKHATTSAADVEKLKILNPIEEAVPAVIPAP